jgi:hypothetical protein
MFAPHFLPTYTYRMNNNVIAVPSPDCNDLDHRSHDTEAKIKMDLAMLLEFSSLRMPSHSRGSFEGSTLGIQPSHYLMLCEAFLYTMGSHSPYAQDDDVEAFERL